MTYGYNFDYACCIYPTAPFVTVDSLKTGLEQMLKSKTEAAIPVVMYSYPIQRALEIDSQNKLAMLYPEHSRSRSQDLPARYHDAGQFYWFKVSAISHNMELLKMKASPIIIPETHVQDIDTEEDWAIAEMKFKLMNSI